MELIRRLSSEFEGHTLTTLMVDGKPAWLASEVGAALEYENPSHFSSKVVGDWSGELEEGKDFRKITGQVLRDLKRLMALHGGPQSSEGSPLHQRAPSAVVLFESGIYLAGLKSDQPAAVRFRRFLVDDLLPQLARTGEYTPTREVRSGKVVDKADRLTVDLKRELRLERKQEIEAGKILLERIDRWRDRGAADSKVLDSYEAEALSRISGQDMKLLKPSVEPGWESPSEIAARLGVSAQKVGRVITKLGLRGQEGMSRAVIGKATGHDRTVETYVYSPAAVEMIEREVKASTTS